MREGTNGAARPFQHFETNAMPVIGNLSARRSSPLRAICEGIAPA